MVETANKPSFKELWDKLKNKFTKRNSVIAAVIFLILVILLLIFILFRPVIIALEDDGKFGPAPLWSSQYVTEIKFTQGENIVSFACMPDRCTTNWPSYGLGDGNYEVEMWVKNIFGTVLNNTKLDVIIDRTLPVIEVVAPAVTNNPNAGVTIVSEIGATILMNGQEIGVLEETSLVHLLALLEGVNTLTFVAKDPAGNMAEKVVEVTLDTQIKLEVSAPAEGATVGNPFTLSGVTDPKAKVTSNGVETTADDAGGFSFSVPFAAATTVTATDEAGNSLSKTINLNAIYVAPPPPPPPAPGPVPPPAPVCTNPYFLGVQDYYASLGWQVDVIVTTTSAANAPLVAATLTAGEFIFEKYDDENFLGRIISSTAFYKMCADSRVLFLSLNSQTGF